MIDLQEVTYHYPGRPQPALDAVSLTIAEGEFVLVAGHSGSGKSTLLRAINGLVPHFTGGKVAGQVFVNGRDAIAAGPQALSRTVGFVNQNPENQTLLEQVEAEIAFPLEQAAVPTGEIELRVTAVLEHLDLLPLRSRYINTLSGGERQRVAIATALALQPRVLLLDEPTSQLDPESALGVLAALARLNEMLGLTIILAEHRLERIVGYVQRGLLMHEGRIVEDGPMADVIAQLAFPPARIALAAQLGWQPVPLTLAEAQTAAATVPTSIEVPERPPSSLPVSDAPEPVLEVRQLSHHYERRSALDEVDLQLLPGQAVVVMGQNGSGKTTLLRCIMGLLPHQKGTLLLHGQDVAGLPTATLARQIGMLPQNPDDLLFADSVTEELESTLRNHKLTTSPEIVIGLLSRLGLADYAAMYPRDLSSGQRQRVALGAVTVNQPGILLLDEPTRGLDAAFKQKMLAIWREWLADGLSLLLVTHDVELAAEIADRVLILENGRVVADGPPEQVLDGQSQFTTEVATLFPGRGWLSVEQSLHGLLPVVE